MKVYLLKKYYSISILCSLIILIFKYLSGSYTTIFELVLKSLIYGSLVGLYLCNRLLESRNVWTLFNNLKINKYKYLTLSVLSFLAISIVITFLTDYLAYGI